MEAWIMNVIEQFGYIGIFLLIAVENIFPPIPSEVILTFGGFMTTTTSLSVTGVIIAATAGSVIGAMVLYWLGSYLGIEKMEKLVRRRGRILRLTPADIHRTYAWFSRYGVWTVFFCRLIPLLRSLISIPAGMARMRFSLFLFLTTAGTFIWNVLLVNIGAALGASWARVLSYMSMYAAVIYAILGMVVAIWFLMLLKRKRKA